MPNQPEKPTTNKIPAFASYQEEAEFWDTHSFADYWEALPPVKVKVSPSLSEGITVRLDEATLTELRALAAEQGIGPTTLMRMWVLERLKELRKQRLAGS